MIYCTEALFKNKLPDRPLSITPDDISLIDKLLKDVGIHIWDEFMNRCVVMLVDNYNIIKDDPGFNIRRILLLFDNGYVVDIMQGDINEVCINHVHTDKED